MLSANIAMAATLKLEAASDNLKIGDSFQVKVALDTEGVETDGVDLYYLKFPADMVEVQDADANKAGVQIAPGVLYPNTLSNKVSNEEGTIDFSQVTSGGQFYSGSGILATIDFKVKSAGWANLVFDFTGGSTIDCNVVGGGADVLTSVNELEIGLADEYGVVPERIVQIPVVSENTENIASSSPRTFSGILDTFSNSPIFYGLVSVFVILLIVWIILRAKRKSNVV